MSIDPRRIELIEPATVEILRRMSPGHRVAAGLRMGAFARSVIEASVRRLHPDWAAAKVAEETLRRFVGG